MTAFYNEIDPYAANWLRNLIAAGHIAPGVVDQRSIEDIDPNELRHYTQCHFFAGIGVWSYALRLAGWPDDRPVWTGSCPCQPFSAAGKGDGFADERHLWPAFHHLIRECRPSVVFGEQVASKDGLEWLDLVQADLEGSGYASAAIDLCAAGFGAPHIRQRLYWVADAVGVQRQRQQDIGPARICGANVQSTECWNGFGDLCATSCGVADAASGRRQRIGHQPTHDEFVPGYSTAFGGLDNANGESATDAVSAGGQLHGSAGNPSGLADAGSERRQQDARSALGDEAADGGAGRLGGQPHTDHLVAGHGQIHRPGPTNGHWRNADWLFCRDGKWRPVEPGTFPLAHGAPARVGRLRAYGNAIVPQVASCFIEAFIGR